MSETLSKYQCHKVVQAAKIVDYSTNHDGDIIIDLQRAELPHVRPDTNLNSDSFKEARELSFPSVRVTKKWMDMHNPVVGDYFIRYEDGYESSSPAAAFESGYKLYLEPPEDSERLTRGVQPWQQRVIAEKAELDVRIDKLAAFINKLTTDSGVDYQTRLLIRQHAEMTGYSRVLGERIVAFGA